MTNIRDLVVHPSLTIHNLIVEPKRVKATYTVRKNDGTENSTDLIFTYDYKWFDPRRKSDWNLASMMVSQVALNYGLFFDNIIFEGIYEAADKRFLIDMMENTSREILVIKFFHHNEFLKPEYTQLQQEKMTRYTAAELVFKEIDSAILHQEVEEIALHEDHYAILSSGGKDSLLTYGIIKELGVPHPIYVNESGRHWFTAINAYRHFNKIDPNTCKPWTNSDRLFNWMVREMPFIKENFQSIRADIYPIRLWTVGVFVFAVLPIVRKRKIKNVLIGNEYDTTVKGNHHGITHYNGLYDQSKYFDNMLTRYYKAKGWHVVQFSLLRSLSELLILKILVKRYPDLQKHQVSCHAAHEEEGRMYPCGKCEKCRRIIGMLVALSEDPERCGFTEMQIEEGLKALSMKKVKQIGSDAAHLYYLLLRANMIASNDHTTKLAHPHPEIMKIRLDKERSTLEDLPEQLRIKLYNLYLNYAEGISKLTNKKWQDISIENL